VKLPWSIPWRQPASAAGPAADDAAAAPADATVAPGDVPRTPAAAMRAQASPSPETTAPTASATPSVSSATPAARVPRPDEIVGPEGAKESIFDAHPPAWLPRALAMAVIAAMAGVFVWNAIHALGSLLLMMLCAVFIALAIEPAVDWLSAKGWRRGAATGVVEVGVIVVILGMITAFGQMFITQLVELVKTIPDTYDTVARWLDNRFHIDLPDQSTAIKQLASEWGTGMANRALDTAGSVVGGLLSTLGVCLIVFYVVAQGPQFRAAICSPLPQAQQRRVLQMWTVAQDKVAGYISSRVVLAFFSATFTTIFLLILTIPSALPLAVFTGLVSQFIPTIGTYIGGAAPVLFALIQSPVKGIAVLAFIVAYQQVENLWLAPRISSRAMDINPAVAFVSVIGVGALMGPIGAFLALPLVATAQAVISTYVRRYELVESDLLDLDVRHGRAKKEKNPPR
jgi:predicted PurR-regulated permease PerM